MQRLQLIGRHICPQKELKPPIRVSVTGAAGNIGYSTVFFACQGRLFGYDQPISLTLIELPGATHSMQGTVMELDDSSFPLLSDVKVTTSLEEGFTDCQVAILIGAKPRGPGMERKDLLSQNGQIFKLTGEALNKVANKNCKVLVVGNPCNTNCMILSHYAPDIPKENFTALTRLDQNRAESLVAQKLGVHTRKVMNVIVWGNHSSTQVPDIQCGFLLDYPKKGITTPIQSALNNYKWVNGDFINLVASRGAAIIKMREKSSSASAANAACDHIHDWIVGTAPEQIVSMAVISDGSYGVPKGLCFSFPVTCKDGSWKIVQNIKWDENMKKRIDATIKDLLEEQQLAFSAM